MKSSRPCLVGLVGLILGTFGPSAPARAETWPVRSAGTRLTGSVATGFDSFREKYSIVDRDTLDDVNEFRTTASLGVLTGTYLRDFFLVEGRAQYGDDSYETGGRLRFLQRLWSGSSRVSFDADIVRRSFGDGSSYQFPNDYTRLYARGYFRQSVSESFAIRLADRLEYQNFEQRTEFDYDYVKNKVSLSGEFEKYLSTWVDVQATYVTMTIPDSTEIEYDAVVPSIEFRYLAALHQGVALRAGGERRIYEENSPRSSYWSGAASLSAEWPFGLSVSGEIENDFEWYQYDRKDAVYFDFAENRTSLLLNWHPSLYATAGAGPTFAFLQSDVSDEDDYSEYGARVAVDYSRASGVWFSLSYEVGRRRYPSFAGEDGDFSLFSDYVFHRIAAFVSQRLWDSVTFTGLLDYQPEDHEREDDDATATLFSLSVAYTF